MYTMRHNHNHNHKPNQRPSGHCCGKNTRIIPQDPQKLTISCTQINYFKSKLTPQVKHLRMTDCKIPDQIFEHICNHSITKLKTIGFSETQFDTLKIKKMCQYNLSNLQSLNLSNNMIEIQGIKWLIKINCPSLTHLFMTNCCLGSQALKIMSKSRWPQLEIFWLKNYNGKYQNMLHRAFLEKMNEIDWKKIQQLQIDRNQIEPISILNILTANCPKIHNFSLRAIYIPIQFYYQLEPLTINRGWAK